MVVADHRCSSRADGIVEFHDVRPDSSLFGDRLKNGGSGLGTANMARWRNPSQLRCRLYPPDNRLSLAVDLSTSGFGHRGRTQSIRLSSRDGWCGYAVA